MADPRIQLFNTILSNTHNDKTYLNNGDTYVKVKSYVNYTFNDTNIQIFTNGLPDYVPSMFGKEFSLDSSGNLDLKWNSLYKNTKLALDENIDELTFNYCVYTIKYPDFETNDHHKNSMFYGTLSSPIAIGVAINGVALSNSFTPTINTVYIDVSGDSTSKIWNNETSNLLNDIVNGENIYYPDAISGGLQFSTCGGHNNSTQYNYHQISHCLTKALSSYDIAHTYIFYETNKNSMIHSPIIGWLLDGFPVYGPIGYKYNYDSSGGVTCATDISGNMITVFKKSSYIDNGIDTSLKYIHNNQQSSYHGYKYNASYAQNDDHGIYLDHCNGIFGPTPEFPNGIYHYHMTLKIDDSGNAIKEVNYYYPYDIDSMIQLNTDSSGLLNYINSNLDSESVQSVLDDITGFWDFEQDFGQDNYPLLGNTGTPVKVTITSEDSWSTYLLKIYTKENTSGTYTYASKVTDQSGNKVYDNFDDWEKDKNQGGLLSFWLRDENNLGYKNLKSKFSIFNNKFETIVPAFPYITNILRGNVQGNELSFLTSDTNDGTNDAWINAWNTLDASKKRFE